MNKIKIEKNIKKINFKTGRYYKKEDTVYLCIGWFDNNMPNWLVSLETGNFYTNHIDEVNPEDFTEIESGQRLTITTDYKFN